MYSLQLPRCWNISKLARGSHQGRFQVSLWGCEMVMEVKRSINMSKIFHALHCTDFQLSFIKSWKYFSVIKFQRSHVVLFISEQDFPCTTKIAWACCVIMMSASLGFTLIGSGHVDTGPCSLDTQSCVVTPMIRNIKWLWDIWDETVRSRLSKIILTARENIEHGKIV